MRTIYLLLVLLSVSNAGLAQHWEIVDSQMVSSSRFDDISFIDNQVGYTGQHGNMFRTDDQGMTWNQVGVIFPDIYIRSVEFINKNIGFVGTLNNVASGGGLFRTIDGGATYTHVNPSGPDRIYEVCGLDHLDALVIGVGAYAEPAYFYKSIDMGNTWQVAKFDMAGGLVECVIIDDLTYLVAGITRSDQQSRAVIFKTNDGGITWREVASSDEPMTYVWKIHLDDSGTGLASIENSNKIFRTNDFGDTWATVEVDSMKQQFGGVAMLDGYIGWVCNQWGSGIFETMDGGNTWQHEPNGFNINKIITFENGIALASGKYIYRYDRNKINVPPKQLPKVFHEMHIGPNPAAHVLSISLNVMQSTRVRLDLVDVHGKLVHSICNEVRKGGDHHFEVPVARHSAGSYIVWLRTNEGHLVQKITITGEQ